MSRGTGRAVRAPPRLSLRDTRKTLKAFTITMGLRGLFETVAAPSTLIFVSYVLRLGVDREKVGIIVSLVSAAAVAQLLSFPLTNRARSRKRTVLIVAAGEPIILAAGLLIVPALPVGARLPVVAAAAFLAAVMLHLTGPVREDWLSATIPPPQRGRYLGNRYRVYGIVCLVSLLLSGQIAERVAPGRAEALTALLLVGCLAGALSVASLGRAAMPESVRSAQVDPRSLGGVIRNGPFMRYLLAMAIYNLPFTIGTPYYQVFYLEALRLKPTVVSFIYIGYWIVRLVGAPALGRVVDRIGSRRVALGSGVIYALFFVVMSLSSAERVWMVVAAWTMVSIADGAYNIALTAALYGTVEGAGSRPAYFAISSVVSTAVMSVGALMGVGLVTALRRAQVDVGPFHLAQFHLLYVVCAVLMAICSLGARLLPGRAGRSRGAQPRP